MKLKSGLAFLTITVGVAALYAQNVAYVVDNAGGHVQIIDLGSRRVTGSVLAGAGASEILIMPDNRTAFIANEGANTVTLVDLTNPAQVSNIQDSKWQGPASLANTPDGLFVYVANDVSNNVGVIDVTTRAPVATVPVGTTPVQVNISESGRFAYAVNQDDGTVSVIDVNRNQVVKILMVGVKPNQFAILPNLNTAYVVNTGSNSLSLVDLANNAVTGTLAVGRAPVSVAFSTDSRRLYVINRDSNSVSVIDTQQNRVLTEIGVGTQPVAMIVTFDSKFGYVTNQGSNTVTLLDLTLNTAETDIPVGAQPFSLMLDPDENFLYVTNLNSGSVSVIDVNTDQVVATIPVGGVPVQFDLLNAPTLLELAPNPALNGSQLTLSGEGFVQNSVVRFSTTSPPQTLTVQPSFLDSRGLHVNVPSFHGSSAVVDVLNPDGNSSEQLTVISGTSSPRIFAGGVVEGAGFTKAPYPVSGNGIVSVFGNFPGLGDKSAMLLPLPTSLGNAKVTFNGVPAPLFATSSAAGQINVLAPSHLVALQTVRVAATVSGETSPVETVNVAPVAPGIFVYPVPAIVHGLRPADLVRGSDPAHPGETLVAYVTGLGITTPPPIDGAAAPSDVLSPTRQTFEVVVGGIPALIRFSGLVPGFSGLYQINFDVPKTAPLGNQVEVQVIAPLYASNTAKVAVR